jgi:hypothetical protein
MPTQILVNNPSRGLMGLLSFFQYSVVLSFLLDYVIIVILRPKDALARSNPLSFSVAVSP